LMEVDGGVRNPLSSVQRPAQTVGRKSLAEKSQVL
jgi:hypothetical protein